MNYALVYQQIIEKFRSQPVNNEYVEEHHIVPRSLGGSDEPSNLICLSPRVHFICHVLLVKMHVGDARTKMLYAYNMMSNFKKYPTSHQYASIRSSVSNLLSRTAQKRNKEYWANPENRKKAGVTQSYLNSLPEVKQRKSDAQHAAWSSPELLKKHAENSRKVAQQADVKAKHKLAMDRIKADPTLKQRRSDGQKRRWAKTKENTNVIT